MPERRSVVVTGASRGLGLACASRLYRAGWTGVAAMRSVDTGLERLRQCTGAEIGDPAPQRWNLGASNISRAHHLRVLPRSLLTCLN